MINIQQLLHSFIPAELFEEPGRRAQAQSLLALNLSAPLLGLLMFFYLYRLEQQMTPSLWVCLVILLLFPLNLAILRQTHSTRAPAVISVILILSMAGYLAVSYGGLRSFTVMWFAVAPFLAFLLLGRNAGLVFTSLTLLLALSLYVFDSGGHQLSDGQHRDLMLISLLICLSFVVVALFTTHASDTHSRFRLLAQKELAYTTLASIADAVISTNEIGSVRYLNKVAEGLTGWNLEEAQYQNLTEVFSVVTDDDEVDAVVLLKRSLQAKGKRLTGISAKLRRRDGVEYVVECSVSPIMHGRSRNPVGAVFVFRDVTQTRRMEQLLSYQASHDPLTSLFNRREFEQYLNKTLDYSKIESEINHAMLYLDLDQFKIINDTCGHLAGDDLLRQISSLLQSRLRRGDIIARLGGDEFGILLKSCPITHAMEMSRGICEAVKDHKFVWDDQAFSVGVSIGVVPIDGKSADLKDVMAAADTACYLAKANGRNRAHLYNPEDTDIKGRVGQMQWVARLQSALEQDEFALNYQLIKRIGGGRDERLQCEILLSLKDAEGQLIPPSTFIAAAERYRLMQNVDRWVIAHTMQWFKDHPEVYKDLDMCSINLSGQSIIDNTFIPFLEDMFEQDLMAPSRLCFEITETAAITNLRMTSDFMNHFKEVGCRFALDDFGSGMSSFAYLKHLPVDFLKIDGLFVRDMLHDPVDQALVRSIREIGGVMGLQTIAEFVESNAILGQLEALKVDYGQGFYLHKPEPIDNLSS